jgi:hypothetical protein
MRDARFMFLTFFGPAKKASLLSGRVPTVLTLSNKIPFNIVGPGPDDVVCAISTKGRILFFKRTPLSQQNLTK